MSDSSSSSSSESSPTKEEDRKAESDTEKKKKKKRKRRYLPEIRRGWTFPARFRRRPEADEKDRVSLPEEKVKKKNARKKLPFGSPEALGKQELTSAAQIASLAGAPEGKEGELATPAMQGTAQALTPEDLAMQINVEEERSKLKEQTETEITELSGEGGEQNILSVLPDVDEKEALALLVTEAIPQAQDTDIATKIQEGAAILTGQDENGVMIVIPNPEELKGHLEKKIPLKEVFSSVDPVRTGIISSLSQYKFCVYVYDLSLGKLIGLWSFVVNRASDAVKELKLYLLSPLIKRYPQCFKVQLKEVKRRSKGHKRPKFKPLKGS